MKCRYRNRSADNSSGLSLPLGNKSKDLYCKTWIGIFSVYSTLYTRRFANHPTARIVLIPHRFVRAVSLRQMMWRGQRLSSGDRSLQLVNQSLFSTNVRFPSCPAVLDKTCPAPAFQRQGRLSNETAVVAATFIAENNTKLRPERSDRPSRFHLFVLLVFCRRTQSSVTTQHSLQSQTQRCVSIVLYVAL